MGRYIKRKTVLQRVPKNIIEDFKVHFPDKSFSDMLQFTYDTSLVKAEIGLKKKDFSDRLGRFLYGRAWKK